MAEAQVPDVKRIEKLRAEAERSIKISAYLASLFLAMAKKFKFLHLLFLALASSDVFQYDVMLKSGEIIQVSSSCLLHETRLSYDNSKFNPYRFRPLGSRVTENWHEYKVSTFGSGLGVNAFRLPADTQDELYLAVTQTKSTFIDE